MAEREAHLVVCPLTLNIQSEVALSEYQWFHPEQVYHEEPSEEQCHPGVVPYD